MKKYTIGGKKRPLQFGIGAYTILCEEMDGDLELVDEVLIATGIRQVQLISALIFAGLSNACEILGEDVDFNRHTVQMWIDEMKQEELTKIIGDFMKSKYMGKAVEDHYSVDEEDANDNSEVESKKK